MNILPMNGDDEWNSTDCSKVGKIKTNKLFSAAVW